MAITAVARRTAPFPTFRLLDDIITILGSTKTTFWPFLENTSSFIRSYKENQHLLTSSDEAATRAIEAEFQPYRHAGGVHSYDFTASLNQYLLGVDHADFEFGNGTVDSAFSVGCWILPRVIADVDLIAKWDSQSGGAVREWRLFIDASNKLSLALEDESANGSEIGATTTSVAADQWSFVVAAYDGDEADPAVALYLNGAADGAGTTTESGTYTAMEASGETLTIGSSLDTNVPAREFSGRIALPFVTGQELSAAEVASLYNIGQKLLGLA